MYLAARVEHDALDRAPERQVQQLGNLLARRLARRGHPLQRLGGRSAMHAGCDGFGELDVGGVIGARAVCDRVLTRLGEHLELVRSLAADRTGVGGNRPKLETEPGEDARIRVVHRLVRLEHAVLVRVERIRILHHELARAHHAETRADFVAELGLDMIEIHRQLFVAFQLLARDVGDDFFGGRLDHEVALMAVLDAQQVGAVFVPASGFLPQLGRLHDRHQ